MSGGFSPADLPAGGEEMAESDNYDASEFTGGAISREYISPRAFSNFFPFDLNRNICALFRVVEREVTRCREIGWAIIKVRCFRIASSAIKFAIFGSFVATRSKCIVLSRVSVVRVRTMGTREEEEAWEASDDGGATMR